MTSKPYVAQKGASPLGAMIALRYASRQIAPLPNDEINWLLEDEEDQFYFDILLYQDCIDGNASAADRLDRRRTDHLVAARDFLSTSFFVTYPEHAQKLYQITPETTPRLCKLLQEGELDRVDLLQEIGHILSERTAKNEAPSDTEG